MLEPLVFAIEVACGQEKAFSIFVRDMGSWWPLQQRAMSLYEGQTARELNIEPRSGGTIVEVGEDGTEHLWGTIREFDPPDSVSMDFHMGLPADNASLVRITFTELDGGRTRVVLTHSRWEAFGDLAEQMRGGYGSSWALILGGYEAACEGAV